MSQIFHQQHEHVRAHHPIFGAVFILAFLGWAADRLNRSASTTRAPRRRASSRCRSATRTTSAGWGSTAATATPRWKRSSFANIPPTKTCMNCHSQIWSTSPTLEPVRASFRTGPVDPLDARQRSAGFRLFQSQHSRQQGRGLRDLPRPGGPDAAHLAGEFAADGVVPELPSPSGKVLQAARVHHHHGLSAGGRPGSRSGAGWWRNTRYRTRALLTSCSTCHR